MFTYTHSQASKMSLHLEPNVRSCQRRFCGAGLAGPPGKLPPSLAWAAAQGCRWLSLPGLPALRTRSRCSRSVSAGPPAASPKQFMGSLELEIKISLNELCVLVSFKGFEAVAGLLFKYGMKRSIKTSATRANHRK